MAEEIPRRSAHSYPSSNQDGLLQGGSGSMMGCGVAVISSLFAFSLELSPSRPHCGGDQELSMKCSLFSKAGFPSCSYNTSSFFEMFFIIICHRLFTCVCLLIFYLPPSLNCKLSENFFSVPSIVFPAPSTVSGILETPSKCLLSE